MCSAVKHIVIIIIVKENVIDNGRFMKECETAPAGFEAAKANFDNIKTTVDALLEASSVN